MVPPRGQTNVLESSHSNADLLKRIEKLESTVLNQKGSVDARSSYSSNEKHVEGLESDIFGPEKLSGSEGDQSGDQDSRLLENIGTREDALVSALIL